MGRWSHRNDGLDPELDYLDMYRNLVFYEFPWDLNQALSFALFRTFAVPSIGGLLDRTGEFERRCQQRYDDTSLLLEQPLLAGFEDPDSRQAIRRINQMHHRYPISNDDLRYVLATFVVVPKRWLDDYGWRALSPTEVRASVRYYNELGRRLGVTDLPQSYTDYDHLLQAYEHEHFAFDAGARRVADATLALIGSFYPRGTRRLVERFSRSIMDAELLHALHYAQPGRPICRLSRLALQARGQLIAALPARRRPRLVRDMPRIRSYPGGFDVAHLGTFAMPAEPG